MVHRLIRFSQMLAFAGCLLPLMAQGPQPGGTAAREKVETARPAQGRGGGDDLPTELPVNKKGAAAMPAPPEKGGARPRGSGMCIVHVDNRTDLVIRVWIDRENRGMVGRYGDLYQYAIAGGTELSARAYFDDGSTLTWGPTRVNCPEDGVYLYRLTR